LRTGVAILFPLYQILIKNELFFIFPVAIQEKRKYFCEPDYPTVLQCGNLLESQAFTASEKVLAQQNTGDTLLMQVKVINWY
jgi:hypothetical protein